MERARVTWTDERLDDLSQRLTDGLGRIDEDLRSLRTELGSRISSLEARTEQRIDALQATMIRIGGAMMVAVLATLVSVIATRG